MFSRHSKIESGKLSFSFDDIRRKSIARKISRELTENITEPATHKENYITVEDDILITLTDKKCEEYDIYNKELYKKNIKLFNDIREKLVGTVLELKCEPLPPPEPSNLERLILLRQRNQSFNCLDQTAAVLYLLSHGYKLVNDINGPLSADIYQKKTVLFEAYQAIEFADELAHIRGENWRNITNKFNTYKIMEANNIIPSAPPIDERQTIAYQPPPTTKWDMPSPDSYLSIQSVRPASRF